MKSISIQNSITGFMSAFAILVVLFSLHIATYAQVPDFLWAKSAGGASSDQGNGIVTDNEGNMIVTGFFRGTATFGENTLISSGESDIFIAKYDALGNLLWAKQAGGTGYDEGNGIALLETDLLIVITGWTSSASLTFDWITLTDPHGMFIAMYDNSGNVYWVKGAGGTGSCSGNGITTAGNDIVVTGSFTDIATFDTISLTSLGNADMFIAKYDASGNVLWAKSKGSFAHESGSDIAGDRLGNSIVIGMGIHIITWSQPYTTSVKVAIPMRMTAYLWREGTTSTLVGLSHHLL